MSKNQIPVVLHRIGPQTGELTRAWSIDGSTINEEERTVELSFSSEEPYRRWFGNEVLSHDAGAADLSRLQEVGVLLFSHGRDARYGRMPIGTIEKAWIDANTRKARALVRFDDDEDSEKVFRKVVKGVIKGVSVGYNVTNWEEVKAGSVSANGRHQGPAYVALKWQPFEISIEPTPADPTVGVGRSAESAPQNYEGDDNNMPGLKHIALAAQGLVHAPDTGGAPGATSGAAPATEPVARSTEPDAAALARAAEAERARTTEIMDLCRTFSVEPDEYIRSGAQVSAVKDAILEQLRTARQPQTPALGTVHVTVEETDKIRAAASDGLLLRAGVGVAKPAPGANEFRGMSLRDLAIDCAVRAGVTNAHRMSDEELMQTVLSRDGNNMFPDSTFQGILSNAVDKTLSSAYQEVPTTFQTWTSKGSNSDFKAAEHYRISEAGELELTPQNAEIPYDEPMKDEKVTKSVITYSKRWGFTRQAFINDDLSMLNRVPRAYVTAAKRGLNRLVYKMLATNPVIFDGKNLFDPAHKNLGTILDVPNEKTMSEARTAMRLQKAIRGLATLNLTPKYMLVPAALETDATKFIYSPTDMTSNNSAVINVFRNATTLIVDAELDAYSPSAWYLSADPSTVDTIEVTYLLGREEPTLETRVAFDRLGMEFRIYFDYGVTVLDSRGLYKNPGKASE
ncbi:prohead protease/major capsid protein fusion protein [Paenibacillus thiaminolyticus]|uniref:prohead protease/major capsid protein fusion protein n=1 Tax=Paenibacillus thiaminolyticus TaxID=49283 RepID=UPI002543B197|nr:prohead protease/major capsid protein fusion protein [Paenibacillus thiaminolyticus]WII39188.1 HK97 family phage prohead protease [Paenibacillus thiaminolyticus]